MRIGLALINLDRDDARLAHMQAELDRLGLTFERFPAVYGLDVPEALRGHFLDAKGAPSPRLKPGEIGVYASHLSLYHQLLARDDLDALLIMEDDLEFAPDFAGVLAALSLLKQPFDLIRLSNPAKAPYRVEQALGTGRSLVTYLRVPNNTGCYLVTKAAAAKIAGFCGQRVSAIDEDLRRPWELGLETFGVLPPPVRANIFETSSIDAIGQRALGRESLWQKLRRRHWPGPSRMMRQLRWQARHFGVRGYAAAILRGSLASMLKRFGQREKAAALLRME